MPKALEPTAERQREWLDLCVKFVEKTHGGRAVFAARVDRDEKSQHVVDVFACPRYEKVTKTGMRADWVSPTRFGKLLCAGNKAEIARRLRQSDDPPELERFATGPRQVGWTLQTLWANFLKDSGMQIEPKSEKRRLAPDRLEPEEYAAGKIAAAERAEAQAKERLARVEAIEAHQRQIDANRRARLEEEAEYLQKRRAAAEQAEAAMAAERRQLAAQRRGLESLAAEVAGFVGKPLSAPLDGRWAGFGSSTNTQGT